MDEDKEFKALVTDALLSILSMQFVMLDIVKWKDTLDILPENIKNQIPIVLDSVKDTAAKLARYT